MLQNQAKVPVYWCDDPILWTPCVLGKACGICIAHSLRKKLRTVCPNLTIVSPVYWVPVKVALSLVDAGTAEYHKVLGYECIKLTFSRLAHLRDASCKIDLAMLISYADGQPRARAAVDIGWSGQIPDVTRANWTPEVMRASREQIQSFT